MNEQYQIVDLTLARKGEEIIIYCRQLGTQDLIGLDSLQIGQKVVELINAVTPYDFGKYQQLISEQNGSEKKDA